MQKLMLNCVMVLGSALLVGPMSNAAMGAATTDVVLAELTVDANAANKYEKPQVVAVRHSMHEFLGSKSVPRKNPACPSMDVDDCVIDELVPVKGEATVYTVSFYSPFDNGCEPDDGVTCPISDRLQKEITVPGRPSTAVLAAIRSGDKGHFVAEVERAMVPDVVVKFDYSKCPYIDPEDNPFEVCRAGMTETAGQRPGYLLRVLYR